MNNWLHTFKKSSLYKDSSPKDKKMLIIHASSCNSKPVFGEMSFAFVYIQYLWILFIYNGCQWGQCCS